MSKKLSDKILTILELFKRRKTGGAIGLISENFINKNPYIWYLNKIHDNELVPFEIYGITMYLSLTDEGISHDLLHYGERELEATAIMRSEFKRIKNSTQGTTTVLEIGANRGYYAFQAADILGESAEIYAIEPSLDNIESLKKGISTNGFGRIIELDHCAIGAETTTGDLNLSAKSNSHTLQSIPESKSSKYSGETLEVDVYSIDDYLDIIEKQPEEIDIIRMDIEGYEWHAFQGMDLILQSNSPVVIFVELHPHRVEHNRLESIVDDIEHNGFELINASSSVATDLEDFDAIKSHLDTEKGSHSVELIAKRSS